MGGEITRLLRAALTDEDSSLSTGKGVMGGLSALDCPALLGSCLLAENTPSPPLPPGGATTAGVPGLTAVVEPHTDSLLA